MPMDDALRVPFIEKSEPEMSDGRQYWRPWSLRRPALISFILLCVGLLFANELAAYGCREYGSCRVFGDSVGISGDMPMLSTFVYRTVPTVLGIALGLRWYATHYDIIRLEAYAQMSSKHGAQGSKSLFLQYPYEFVVALPFKALLNEHYVVALSSSVLCVVSYALVPLVSNMFDNTIGSTSVFANASRVEFNTTARQVSANFTFSAYDVSWRNGPLLPFTTKDFSLLPVNSLEESPVFRLGENWTFVTTQYEADLECAEAHHINYNYSYWADNNHLVVEIFQDESSDSVVRVCDALGQERVDEWNLYNSNNCKELASFVAPWAGLYAQLVPLDGSNLPVEGPPVFMFSWASGSSSGYPNVPANISSPHPLELTAIFCTTRYYAQTVNATVSMPSGTVYPDAVHPIGKREEIDPLPGFTKLIAGETLTNDSMWLESVFVPQPKREVIGITPLRFGYPLDRIIDLKDDLEQSFGLAARPVEPKRVPTTSRSNVYLSMTNTLMAFALGDMQRDTMELEKLLDPKELGNSLRKALKLWFAFAVATETARSTERSTTIVVERRLRHVKITVNKDWSLAARIGLPLVAVLAALLTYLLEGRPYLITGEPSTMAAALKLLSASPALCAVMRHSEYHPMKTLMAELDRRGFFFRMGPNKEGILRIGVFRGDGERGEEVLEGSEDLNVLEDPAPGTQVQKDSEWVSPDLIAKANVALFPIIILALIIITVWSLTRDGIRMPDDPSSPWSKLSFGTFPTILGLTAEALLVVLGATQCMMIPYQALVTKKAKYIDTLNSQYKRNPPYLQLRQPFKRGQYTLLVLSLTILIANALTVALSSIFSHFPHLPEIAKLHDPSEKGIPRARQEMFFQLNREIANPGYAPSWTTPQYYIDSPFTIAPIRESRTYATRAFGVDVNCTVVPEDRVTFPCSTIARSRGTPIPPECETVWNITDNVMILHSPCGGNEPSINITWRGSSLDHVKSDERCPGLIFPLWAQNQRWTVDLPDRIPKRPGYNTTLFRFGSEDKYDFVVLNCSVADRIANVDATVDRGNVTSVKNVVFESFDVTATNSLARDFFKVTERLAKEYKIYGNFPIQDINLLVAQVNPSVARNETHVPTSAVVAESFASVLQRLFPLLLRLYADEIFGVTYATEYTEYRAHIMMIPFGVAIGVLVLCLCVVVKVYTKHAGRVMGHLPWSLAGMYSQLYASNAKSDTNGARKGLEVVQEVELSAEYAYGEYPNGLGKHYGVYKVVDDDLQLSMVELVT
ncbi:hypothetical protein DFP73DRAFT_587568 [Morchella snyderi]|nr:hypothetical protein DFP73DRAFT_587568 [Morchella snyderi]